VAVKGLGGFHLMCDATDDAAIDRLRRRKHRPDKPFAVLVPDLGTARMVADVSDAEAHLLTSPARPIVLLRARSTSPLSALVAPGNPLVGVMLAYTPVHHLLFATRLGPLVCTSGNRSGEPIVHRDDDVEAVLAPLADGVVSHDRPIEVPCDDSVVRVVGRRLLPVRRARGYAPLPVPWADARRAVLAVGGELKSTCCVASPHHAWVSQHIGEQGTLATLEAFEATVDRFTRTYAVTPDVVAVDAHPGYATSQWGRRSDIGDVVEVQPPHAHVAAAMAEHRLDPHRPVLGIVFDGTGYGTDGTIWGGEVLLATATGFERVAHLAPVPLPGGDAAITNPYRVALAHLHAAGIDWSDDLAPVRSLADDGDTARRLLHHQLTTGLSCVATSSMGRLFDAVAALVGLRQRISFEAQAAIELEVAAAGAGRVDRGYRLTLAPSAHGAAVAATAPLVRAVVDDLRTGVPTGDIAAGFHAAVVALAADVVDRWGDRADHVVLSGGVFQNALLTEWTVDRLADRGVVALTHHLVPPNDGGLALGQAFVAAHAPTTTRRRPQEV
jgi:hydrogenase maturation protein HypF